MIIKKNKSSSFSKPALESKPVLRAESGDYRKCLLSPGSVAVIGASKKPGTIGYSVMKCLVDSHFQGAIYPVNPTLDTMMGVKCYPSILDVPERVDLVVIVVAAARVLRVAEECGQKGVCALVVISDGFKETGPEGLKLEQKLLEIVRQCGMRMVGPNSMGIINPDPKVSLNASFSSVFPSGGSLAIISQSGALGATILEYMMNTDVGVSFFVSVGNSADLKAIDFLEISDKDPHTRAIVLYLESFDSPEKFAALTRRISLTKPIVVIKTGRTEAGSKAASSHTGAMVSKEVAVNALFHQSGLIRVDTFLELIGTSVLVSSQPLPKGRRIAILTSAGGAATISADSSEHYRLTVPDFSAETQSKIKAIVSRPVSLHNPLDLTGGAPPEEYFKVAEILAQDPDNDVLLCIWGPAVIISNEAIEDIITRVSAICRKNNKPLVTCFMIPEFNERIQVGKKSHVPVFQAPEGAVSAISRFCDYVDAIHRIKTGKVPVFEDIQKRQARQLIEAAKNRADKSPFWLRPDEVSDLLDCYGILQAKTFIARTSGEAAKIASRIGFPVAVKLFSTTLVHKTEVGGVALGLKSEAEVKKAFEGIYHNLKMAGQPEAMEGVTLQPMVNDGIEIIVGITQDALGPLIMMGLGGIFTEVLKDTVFRMCPLTDIDAKEMISSIRAVKLFKGFRDIKPRDIPAMEELLLRVSALVNDIPEISELDLNPVKVMSQGEGYRVVDARIAINRQ